VQEKKKSRRGFWIGLAVAAVGIVAAGIWVVGPLWEEVQQRRQAFAAANTQAGQTVTAFVGDLSSAAAASGRLLPQRQVELALSLSGKVDKVHVAVGDSVQAGDVLLQLEADALQRAVRSAEQALAIQEANLAELKAGASAEDRAVAAAAVESAQASLTSAQAGLESARVSLIKAQLSRDALQDADVTVKASLVSAEAALSSAQAQLAALLEGADAETVEQARLNLEQARNSLWHLQLERDALNGRSSTPDYVKKQMEAQVANAEITVRLAEITYQQAQEGATDAAIAAARAAVAQAEAQVISVRANLNDIDDQIAQAEAVVTQAEAGVAQAEAGVLQATAGVAQAEANQASLLAGASTAKIIMAEAQVEQARISLEDVQANLSKVVLAAPFGGVVTEVYVAEGEWASGLAVELIDSDSLEVVLEVDEIDIGQIAVGQPTVVTLEAWPGEELAGEVVSIAPKARVQSEIVTYEVHLRLEAGDLAVRTGMTADARMITAQRENVLLVPSRAITADREANKYYVYLVEGDTVAKSEVTVGLRDRSFTEITSGLEEGDTLFVGEIEEGLPFGLPGSEQGPAMRFLRGGG